MAASKAPNNEEGTFKIYECVVLIIIVQILITLSGRGLSNNEFEITRCLSFVDTVVQFTPHSFAKCETQ